MFPLEILTMLGSGLLGGMMTIWGMKLKAQRVQNELLMARNNAQYKAFKDAREYGNDKFQFTRRLIALGTVFSVLILPKLAAIFVPTIAVTVGYTEFRPGFLFLTDGREVVEWITNTGLTLTPLDTHAVSAVMGLYFGSSITRNS